MARPRMEGLSYFPHDVNASNDDKVAQFVAIHGLAGHAFFFCMLERIYQAPSGELKASNDLKRLWCRQMNITEKAFDKFMKDALRIGLFSKPDFKEKQIITSAGIKKRFAVVSRKRETSRNVSATETRQEQDRKPAETPERKEKDSKAKKMEGESKRSSQPPSPLSSRHDTAKKKAIEAYPLFLSQLDCHFNDGKRLEISDNLSCQTFQRLLELANNDIGVIKAKRDADTLEHEFVNCFAVIELADFEGRRPGK